MTALARVVRRGARSPRWRARCLLVRCARGLLWLLPACTGAFYSQFDHHGGSIPAGAPAAAQAGLLHGKADVLSRLGAPHEVLWLADGDIFVYRASAADVELININAGVLTGAFVPLYARWVGTYADRTLFVEFDAQGRVLALTAGEGSR